MEPVDWTRIAGGRAAVDRAFHAVESTVKTMQARFADVLDAIGPPGMASWDPIGGTIELRGRTFRAQQLGSFDGSSWVWSWANTELSIPEEMTTLARSLRDAAERLEIPALREPMIADDDEELPHRFGGIAIAHGFGEAFYLANQSQVYLVLPGQLDAIEPPPPAAKHIATLFSHQRRTLVDVLAHLRGDEELAPLVWTQVDDDRATLAGTGYALTLVRHDRLREVLAQIEALPHGRDVARGAGTVFTLHAAIDRSYGETAYTIAHGAWAPAEHFSGHGRVPWQAIAICERLNSLDGVALFDALLEDFYPRA